MSWYRVLRVSGGGGEEGGGGREEKGRIGRHVVTPRHKLMESLDLNKRTGISQIFGVLLFSVLSVCLFHT